MALPSLAALLLSTAAAAQHEGHQHHSQQHSQQQQQQPSSMYSRNLQHQKEETLARWRSLLTSTPGFDLSQLRPLDLVLDETDPAHRRAYQKGAGGFLEPYDFRNYQHDFEGVLDLADLMGAGDNGGGGGANNNGNGNGAVGGDSGGGGFVTGMSDHEHHSSGRIGHTNFDLYRGIGLRHDDGKDAPTASERRDSQSLRGLAAASMPDKEDEEEPSYDSFFRYTADDDPEEQMGYEVVDPLELMTDDASSSLAERRLQGGGSYHGKSSSSSAQGFASGNSNSNPHTNNNNNDIEALAKTTDTSPPIIRATFPPADTAIGAHQTFGALVKDDFGVQSVCLQFKDHLSKRSGCFQLENVSGAGGGRRLNDDGDGGNNSMEGGRRGLGRKRGKGKGGGNQTNGRNQGGSGYSESDIWELSFEGFHLFAGKEWQYRIKSQDGARNRKSTPWRNFVIDERAAADGDDDEEGAEEEEETEDATEESSEDEETELAAVLGQEVRDKDWPHGGVVQLSTGRIMFYFDDHPYVCTGTVLEDTPNDRTVILTAGHCVYQYRPGHQGGGRFAEHALYIPNQVDTRSKKSNGVCTDDPLGCWIPAFGVVHYEWTTKSFPDSVPWDFAYYVIPNDPASHEGGFIHEGQPNLSKVLDDIVEPMPIDFNWSNNDGPHMNLPGELIHGLGYSFNMDPAFRYCAAPMKTKFGIDEYENLWLDICEMTGGSSGGPWMKDVDSSGRGTVISVNSWGYGGSPGMAGPNFNTASGGHAECLLERAKGARFEDVVNRGIVVSDC